MSEQDMLDREVPEGAPARDPEAAQRALVRVQHLLDKQHRVESLVHREQTPAADRKPLVEQLVHRQAAAGEDADRVRQHGENRAAPPVLHPADRQCRDRHPTPQGAPA